MKRTRKPASVRDFRIGGAERDRTVDLLNAIQALSQLSYSPTTEGAKIARGRAAVEREQTARSSLGSGCSTRAIHSVEFAPARCGRHLDRNDLSEFAAPPK